VIKPRQSDKDPMYQTLKPNFLSATSAVTAERNLVLVHQHGAQAIGDFQQIADIVRRKAPDIEVFIASNDGASSVTRRKAAQRPTLIFSPLYLRYFQPGRGKIYAGQLLTKVQQMQRLLAAGVPVPPFWHSSIGGRPDPAQFGDYVLAKSAVLGASKGEGITLMRTTTALGMLDRLGDVFIQRFVDTGPYASQYRVFTIFGRPVFAYKNTSTVPRGSLDVSDEQLAKTDVQARHFSGGRITAQRRTKTLCDESDVLALAGAAWEAIPEVPFHGCDIVREQSTGALYVLEINPGGNTWIFSRPSTPAVIKELGGYDLTRQFDAFETIADALIERTRAEAE
jgi:hypothetical protein